MDQPSEEFEVYLEMAAQVARKVAWSEDDREDLQQAGLLELLKTMKSASWTAADNQPAYAYTVLHRTMQWCYTAADRTDALMPLEAAGERADDTTFEDDPFAGLEDYLDFLREEVGATECRIASELLSPSARVLALAHREMQEKQRRFQTGEKVRGHSTLVVTHRHIAETLGLGEASWQAQLSKVRSSTRDWLERKA